MVAGSVGVRPSSLTHIPQVCGGWIVKNPLNAKLRPGLAQVLEETPPAAKQHRRQGDFQLVYHAQVQVLLDHIRPRQVSPAEKDQLLRAYWSIPDRQVETSVVLVNTVWKPCYRTA